MVVRSNMTSVGIKPVKPQTSDKVPGRPPLCPPSPDLSGLSQEEMAIIMSVMRKHEQFEEAERNRTKQLETNLKELEEQVRHETANKSKMKGIDLHLCRLCHRNKFTDGIGRVCADCHKRVCNNCGRFTHSKTADKRHKSIRGKWRCRLCIMRRDILCKSGDWFHSEEVSMRKMSLNDSEAGYLGQTSGDTGRLHLNDNATFDCDIRTDSELLENSTHPINGKSTNKSHRRRPVKSCDSVPSRDEDESYVSERQFHKEREHDRKRRNQMRNRKKVTTRVHPQASQVTGQKSSYRPHATHRQVSFESDNSDRTYQSNSEMNEGDVSDLSVTPSIIDEPHQDSKSRILRPMKSQERPKGDAINRKSSIKEERPAIKRGDSRTDESVKNDKGDDLDSQTDDRNARQLSRGNSQTEDSPQYNRIKRQDAMSCSSSSTSIVSDVKHTADIVKRKMSIVDHSAIVKPNTTETKPRHRLPLNLESTRNSKIFLSLPDHDSVQPCATTSYVENLLTPPTPTYRRISLSQCQNLNIKAQQDNDDGRYLPSNPHQVIIHKDRNDKTCRTGGLGMRIIGGKQMDDGTLGAHVTYVAPGGPADVQGNITVGDRLLQWNGRSLVGATYEETKQMIDASGDIVQVVVLYISIDERERTMSKTPEPEVPPGIPKSDSADATILLKVDDQETNDSITQYVVHRPKRRMLPKTPIEIKRETRHISGRLLAQLEYAANCNHLKIGILRAEGIKPRAGSQKKLPRPSIMIHLLPNRSTTRRYETQPGFDTTTPEWNSTFVFQNITRDHIEEAALEITIWDHNAIEAENEFLGEVLLDLKDAKLNNDAIWYNLEDHDENSSPLPNTQKKFDGFSCQSSTCSSADTGIQRQVSVSSHSTSSACTPPLTRSCDIRTLPVTPSRDRRKSNIHLKYATNRDNKSRKESPKDSPYNSDHDTRVSLLRHDSLNRDSFTMKVKRKMSSAVLKVSSGLLVMDKTKDSDDDSSQRSARSLSVAELDGAKGTNSLSPSSSRRSTIQMELLAPPRPMSCASAHSAFYDDLSEDEKLLSGLPSPDRLAPEGDDITSQLGPGQVPPKPVMEKIIKGDMKLAFMVTKGQLEVDIICVKGLTNGPNVAAPDTYVKTYLIEGTKIIQKKKTKVFKASFDPVYRQTLKYSACNVSGRCMKVNVWEKQKTFDKKGCLGEVVVKLDNLDLGQHTTGWYKMFQVSATDLGSSESLVHW